MDNIIAMEEGHGECNLTSDDSGLDLRKSAILGFDVREEVSASDQILKDVASTMLALWLFGELDTYIVLSVTKTFSSPMMFGWRMLERISNSR